MTSNSRIIGFSLDRELLISLESLSDTLTKIFKDEEYYYKWAIVFSHSTIQASMCLCLDVVDSRLVRNRNSYDKDYGDLDTIEWLYKKLLKTEFIIYTNALIINENDFPLKFIQTLQIVRNTFIHQSPELYVFEKQELRELIMLSVRLIRFLVSHSERMALDIIKNDIENVICTIENQLTNNWCGTATLPHN